MGWFTGTQDRVKQMNTRTPGQMRTIEDIAGGGGMLNDPTYQAGSNYLRQMMDMSPEMFQQFSAPYMRQFQEETLPGIAERFAGVGGLSSSGMTQSMGQAGAGLMEKLAAMKGNMGMQAAQTGLGYAQAPYQQQLEAANISPYDNIYMRGQPGIAQYAAQGFGGMAGQGATSWFSNWLKGGQQ